MLFATQILIFIVIINGIFTFYFLKDLIQHKSELQFGVKSVFLAASTAILFFLSSFGISDFALSTLLYRKTKWVSDKMLPGTLNTQCVLPVACMALSFISVIDVDIKTLLVCIASQVLGAYLGPQLVVKLSAKMIRRFIGVGLIVATLSIVTQKLDLFPTGGTATGLYGIKLMIASVCLFILGSLNNIGIGSYAPTMAVIYALGMNPAVAFPIMMGASTFSVPIGSMQFIKYGLYDRKITLFAATFGVAGVLVGVYFVKECDLSNLQWLIAAILLYSGYTILHNEIKQKNNDALSIDQPQIL